MTIITEPEVTIIADSINEEGNRLTTFQLRYWRPIHAEVLRHRVFSHSVRSSRACPINKYIEQVLENPWGPAYWGKNQKGMVPGEPLDSGEMQQAIFAWEQAAKSSALIAAALNKLEIHKQIVNRLMEPFTYVDDVMTGTEWKNFYDLRTAPDAQYEIQQLAKKMKKAQDESEPKELKEGEWHLPYVTDLIKSKYSLPEQQMISAARCARVSYKLFDGTTDPQKDIELATRLYIDNHMSPFEHQATPSTYNELCGNLVGWDQMRKFLELKLISLN